MPKDMIEKSIAGLANAKPGRLSDAVDNVLPRGGDGVALRASQAIDVSALLASGEDGRPRFLEAIDNAGPGRFSFGSDWRSALSEAKEVYDRLAVGETATDTFEYTIQLGPFRATAFVTVTMTGVNDAPTLAAGKLTTTEDGPAVSLDLSALGDDIDSDDDGTTLFYSVSDLPDGGSVIIDGTTLTFDPERSFQDLAAGETRDLVIGVWAHDAHGANAYNEVTVTITGADEEPIAPGFTNITSGSNGRSLGPSISADGSRVAFNSGATNLAGNGTAESEFSGVFLHDRETGETISITDGGDDDSFGAAISADGTKVAFSSAAGNLIDGEPDPDSFDVDVFVHDVASGTTRNITLGGDRHHNAPSISGDGSRITFYSSSSNLIDGEVDDDGFMDIFIYDMNTGEMDNITHGANESSYRHSISADGSTVIFNSFAANLEGPGEFEDFVERVFIYDVESGVTTGLTSDANDGSSGTAISADGSRVAFISAATNLVEGEADFNGSGFDVFVFERTTGVMTNITNGANDTSFDPQFSADGTKVVFESFATNLTDGVPDLNGGFSDIFVYDMNTGITTNVTNGADDRSRSPSISADGSSIAFQSDANNLVGNSEAVDFTSIFVFDT